MFSERPGLQQQPMRPSPSVFPQRQLTRQVNRPVILSQFQDANGQLDFEKISATAKQVHAIYQEVSPMVKPIITRFLNK